MLKIVLSTVLSLGILQASSQKGYMIDGNISGANDGVKVFLVENEKVDTVAVTTIKNGHFRFAGELPVAPRWYSIRIDTGSRKSCFNRQPGFHLFWRTRMCR